MYPSNFSKLDVGAHSVVVVENFDSQHISIDFDSIFLAVI